MCAIFSNYPSLESPVVCLSSFVAHTDNARINKINYFINDYSIPIRRYISTVNIDKILNSIEYVSNIIQSILLAALINSYSRAPISETIPIRSEKNGVGAAGRLDTGG